MIEYEIIDDRLVLVHDCVLTLASTFSIGNYSRLDRYCSICGKNESIIYNGGELNKDD